MTNLEKYKKAFCDAFETTEEKLVGLKYQGVELWDSVGHMTLVANLQEQFFNRSIICYIHVAWNYFIRSD